jgi:phage terminase small subunit
MKLVRGDRSSRINHNELMPGVELPEKPDWLTDSASAHWDRIVGELDIMGCAHRADQDVITQYVLLTDAITRLGETLVKGSRPGA